MNMNKNLALALLFLGARYLGSDSLDGLRQTPPGCTGKTRNLDRSGFGGWFGGYKLRLKACAGSAGTAGSESLVATDYSPSSCARNDSLNVLGDKIDNATNYPLDPLNTFYQPCGNS